MKALITTSLATPETTGRNFVRFVIASLKSMGISYNRTFNESLTAGQVNNYDLLIAPRYIGESEIEAMIDDVTMTKPVVLLGNQSGAAGFGLTPGISGALSASVDQYFDADFAESDYMAMFGKWATLTDGTGIITASAIDPLSAGAQAQAGKVMAWSSTTAGGSRFYACSNPVDRDCFLNILITAAFRDGELANPPQEAPVFIDLDHPNGTTVAATEETIDNFMRPVPNGGVMWGGIDNATAGIFDNMPVATSKAIKKWTDTGKLKLCVHFHETLPVSGTWPAISDVMTKEQQETEYLGDKAVIEGHGLSLGDPVHANLGNNAWNEATLELYSGDTSKASDGANTVSQVGYNCRTIRTRSTSTRYDGDQNEQFEHNVFGPKRMMRGILLLNAYDMEGGAAPFTTIAEWRDSFRSVLFAMNSGMVLYMHDDDFIEADQDPGVDKHGVEVYGMMSQMHNWMKGVVKFWADPTDYVGVRNFI